MKCPRCDYNHPRKKAGMTCSACSYRFTFDPSGWTTAGLTDGKFLSFVRSASMNGTLYYTRNQLYGAYCRKQKPQRVLHYIAIAVLAIFAGNQLLNGSLIFGFLLFVPLFWIVRSAFRVKPHVVAPKKFSSWVEQWRNDGKPLEKMIVGPTLHQPPPDWQESDIYDYGVEKLLIVQRDELVDLMVLNNTHAKERALVIAESGYPAYLMPLAQRLLEQDPSLPVHLLHDATPEGQQMATRVRRMNLPLEGREIIDLGLWPDDFKRLKRTRALDSNGDGELAADVLPAGMLAGGLAACFLGAATFGDLLDQDDADDAAADVIGDFG